MTLREPVEIYVTDANDTTMLARQVGWITKAGHFWALDMRSGDVTSDRPVFVLETGG